MPGSILGSDIEVAKGVNLPYGKTKPKSCARLDLADRMVYSFGLPAFRMLIEGVRVHDWESYYQFHDIANFTQDSQVKLFAEYTRCKLKEVAGV